MNIIGTKGYILVISVLMALVIGCQATPASQIVGEPTSTPELALPIATPGDASEQATATPTEVVELVATAEPPPTALPTAMPEPTPTEEPSPTEVPIVSSVTGTVTYLEKIALSPDAKVEIKLVDVSRADAPAITIGEQVIENQGQVPLSFEIEYDPADIDDRFVYAVQARITVGDDLLFINTSSYQVITRDNPSHVELVLDMVGPSPEEPSAPEMVSVPAPVEKASVVVSDTQPYDYTLAVISRLPRGSSCSQFEGFEVDSDGTDILITMSNMEVSPEAIVPCTADYPAIETEIPLGSDFNADETYTVIINGEVVSSFVARDSDGPEMAEMPSPIQKVEVNVTDSAPFEYSLEVISWLPRGSSCSRFGGFDVARRFAGTIEVSVRHLEVTGALVACTADLPVVVTEIPLGTSFEVGETYEVIENGEVSNSFVGRDPEGRAMVKVTSPIEQAEVTASESTPPQYTLEVVSRLPLGSSCSTFNGFDVTRQFSETIEVTITHLEVVDKNTPCTRDLPVVITKVPLGSDFEAGKTYTVVVNETTTETFVVQDSEAQGY